MSRGCKSEPRCFGSDVRRLLLAAEAGQKADIRTYCSGHLGPSGLNQDQRHHGTKQVVWKLSQSPNSAKPASRQTKAQTCVREKQLNEAPAELTAGAASLESGVSEPRQDQDAGRRGDLTLPKISHSSSNSLYGEKLVGGPAKPKLPPIPKQRKLLCSAHSHHEGLNNDDQLKTNQGCGSPVTASQDPWAGKGAAEKHERKLQKALKKLSAQSWPHRDRLAVFSDVFDDTDYDLYVNYMMDSRSPPHNMLSKSFEDLGNGRLREMELEDAETEVCRLEQEAREALEENKRIQNEFQNVPAITGPGDSHTKKLQDNGTVNTDGVQTKRLQVLTVWSEIQQLEEDLKEELVCNVTTAATERSIRVLQTEIVGLIASNDYITAGNTDLENKINVMLNREKLSKTHRRLLWDEILSD